MFVPQYIHVYNIKNEPEHNISIEIACAPWKDSDQLTRPRSLIRLFAGHSALKQTWKTLISLRESTTDRSLRCADVQSCKK